MKVFLSWSGELSHQVAIAFRDWLPSVLQYVEPYVSSEDIDKGARWSTDIAQELEKSLYGLLMITKDNIEAPWIAFEAGALSKALDKARVSPFLVNLKRSELQGPLLQFQSTIFDKGDISKLVFSINNSTEEDVRLDETRLQKVFDVWWPELETQLDKIIKDTPKSSSKQTSGKVGTETILEELLDLVRNQQRILSNPEELLPQNYFGFLVERYFSRSFDIKSTRGLSSRNLREMEMMTRYLTKNYQRLVDILDKIKSKTKPSISAAEMNDITSIMKNLDGVIQDLNDLTQRPEINLRELK